MQLLASLAVVLFLMWGCAASATSRPPMTADTTGDWEGYVTLGATTFHAPVKAALQQTGSDVAGSFAVVGNGAAFGNPGGALQGTVKDNVLQFSAKGCQVECIVTGERCAGTMVTSRYTAQIFLYRKKP